MDKVDILHLFNHQDEPLRIWIEPYGIEYWLKPAESMDIPCHGSSKMIEISVEFGTLVIWESKGAIFDFENIVRKIKPGK